MILFQKTGMIPYGPICLQEPSTNLSWEPGRFGEKLHSIAYNFLRAVENLIGNEVSLLSTTHFFRMKNHETDLSTHQAPTQTEVRLSRSHENHQWAKSDQPPPQSRSKGSLKI